MSIEYLTGDFISTNSPIRDTVNEELISRWLCCPVLSRNEKKRMSQSYEVLVVEDDPVDRRFIAGALLGIDDNLYVETADDGTDAIARLSDESLPDLILFDLNMPRMDGFSFLKKIKDDSRLATIPAVVFSTSTDPEDIARSYRERANAYVAKPSSVSDYSETAKSLIGFWLHRAKRVN